MYQDHQKISKIFIKYKKSINYRLILLSLRSLQQFIFQQEIRLMMLTPLVMLLVLTAQNQFQGYVQVGEWQNTTFNQVFLTSENQFIATTNTSILLVDFSKPNETIKTLGTITNLTGQIKGLYGTQSLGFIDNFQLKTINAKGPQIFSISKRPYVQPKLVVVNKKIYYEHQNYDNLIGIDSYDIETGRIQNGQTVQNTGGQASAQIVFNNETKLLYYGSSAIHSVIIMNLNLEIVQIIKQYQQYVMKISEKGDIIAMNGVVFYVRNQVTKLYQKKLQLEFTRSYWDHGIKFSQRQKTYCQIFIKPTLHEDHSAYLYQVDPYSQEKQLVSESKLLETKVLRDFKTLLGRNIFDYNQIFQLQIQGQQFININNYKLTIPYQRQFSQKDSYSEDGSLLFIAQNKSEETVRLWGIKNDSLICQANRNAPIKNTSQVKFEYDNSRFFVLTDQTLYVFNSSNCEQIKTLSDINITNFWLVKDKSKIVATAVKQIKKMLLELNPLNFTIRNQVEIFSQKQIMLSSQKICGYLSQSFQNEQISYQFLVIYNQRFQIQLKKQVNCPKGQSQYWYLRNGLHHIALLCFDNTRMIYNDESLQLLSTSYFRFGYQNYYNSYQTFRSDLLVQIFGRYLYKYYNNIIKKNYFSYYNQSRDFFYSTDILFKDENIFITLEQEKANQSACYLSVHKIVGNKIQTLREVQIQPLRFNSYVDLKFSEDQKYIIIAGQFSDKITSCYQFQTLNLIFPIPSLNPQQTKLNSHKQPFQPKFSMRNFTPITNVQSGSYTRGNFLDKDAYFYQSSSGQITRYDLKQISLFKPNNITFLTGPIAFSSDSQFILFAGKDNNGKYVIEKWKKYPHQLETIYETPLPSEIQQIQFMPQQERFLIVQNKSLFLKEENNFIKISSQVERFQFIDSHTSICHYTNKTIGFIKLQKTTDSLRFYLGQVSGDLLNLSPQKNLMAVKNGSNIKILNLINNSLVLNSSLPQSQSNVNKMLINSIGTVLVLSNSSSKLFKFQLCPFDRQYLEGKCMCPKFSSLSDGKCICNLNRYIIDHSCQCQSGFTEIDSMCCPRYTKSVVNQTCLCESNRKMKNGKCRCLPEFWEIGTMESSICCPNQIKALQTLINGRCVCDQGRYFVPQTIKCLKCSFLCNTCQTESFIKCQSFSWWFWTIIGAITVFIVLIVILIVFKIKKNKASQKGQQQKDDSKYENILSQQQSIEAEKVEGV